MALGDLLGGFGSGAIGGAVVTLSLANEKYKTELAASEAQTKAATGTMGSSFGKFKALAGPALLAVGVAAVAGAAKAVSAASDQEEAMNKVSEIFGTSADQVKTFAETAADSLGTSETAALSAAGTFGNLFVNVGLTEQAAASMSTGLVALSADLASFNNLGTEDVLEKIRAGLAGEAEPLRAVGIFLSEAKVQQEAYSSGIAEMGAELTDAQKIQARYNIILEESGIAQGDFARTSGSLANQQKALAAQMEDLAADVGKVLLPAITNLVKALTWLLEHLPEITKMVLAYAAAWAILNWAQLATAVSNITRMLIVQAGQLGMATQGMTGYSIAAGGALAVAASMSTKTLELNEAIKANIGWGIDAATMARKLAEEYGGNVKAIQLAIERNITYEEALKQVTAAAKQTGNGIAGAGKDVRRFANMSGTAMKEWRKKTEEAFDAVMGNLDAAKIKWEFSAKSFARAMDNMRIRAQTLDRNMRDIAKSDWVPEGFKKWVIDQGPEALRGFMEQSRKQKEQSIDDWRASGKAVDGAKGSLTNLKSTLGDLNNQKSTATVRVKYEYVGYDPSKPGQ